MTHQASPTPPVDRRRSGSGSGIGAGDLAINYRYQALGGETQRAAFAPRLSLLLPTGEELEGRGTGSAGVQVNLPLSLEVSSLFVLHSNAGMTWAPTARNGAGQEAATTGFNLGQSLIWPARPACNVMLESVWILQDEVTGEDEMTRRSGAWISPGLRGAINLESGMQIVPGIAAPFGVGASRGDLSLFAYLSLGHPRARAALARK